MNISRMQPIMDLIEATLDADVTIQELADQAGYSLWHFCRLFQLEVGLPPMRYRTRRRLAHALYQISRGISVTDAALRYGFDTHAGFYKAFTREYGCSPTEYLKAHQALKPWPLQLSEEQYLMMTPETWKKALSAWGKDDLPLQPIVYEWSGMIADNAIYAGHELVLKAYHNPDHCQHAIRLSHALADAGLPAALPLPLPDGSEALTLGAYHITLCSRLMGKALRPAELLTGDASASGRRIGQTLRQLHNAFDSMPDLPDMRDLHLDEHILSWAMPKAKAHLPAYFPADFEARVRHLADLPRGPIHRDPNPSNLITLKDGCIALIDFDLTECNTRLFDPCYAATGVLLEVIDRADIPWQTQWPLFFQGVMEGYGATPAEREAASTVVLGIEVICLAAFAGSEKLADQFAVNQRMIAWLCEHWM